MPQSGGKSIYIAGPIDGVKGYKKAFDAAERKLSKKGWDVVCSPANVPEEQPLREIMALELDWIARCADAVYMLRGWENSKGAQCEWALARALGLQIIYQDVEEYLALKQP